MSPSLIFDAETGDFVASVGSPGGSAIIHYTAKAITGMLDWNLNAQEAINLPNFAAYNGPIAIEQGRFPQELIDLLEQMGHDITVQELTSGLQAIQKTENGYFGGADPRREGVVMGD
jgi:gamma-glutamyltranspeptidase/glutathione hydrolase